MNITTERLTLRPLSLSDLKTVHAYAGDIENTRYIVALPNETEWETANFLNHVEAEWRKPHPRFYEFAVELDGAQIGAVSIHLDESAARGELGWILNKAYWNRGYATEAARAVLAFARETLKLRGVFAVCDARNPASARVMEKLGMTLRDAGGMREYPKRGETARELIYALEWEN